MHVALLWLTNEDGDLLLARRSYTIDANPGVWAHSVSGGVDDGEAGHEAAAREAREELGLHLPLESLTFLGELSYAPSEEHRLDFTHWHAPVSREVINEVVLDPEEVHEVAWVSLPTFKHMLETEPETIIIGHEKELWGQVLSQLVARNG
jgi:isopentenyldiphosphate isomerase